MVQAMLLAVLGLFVGASAMAQIAPEQDCELDGKVVVECLVAMKEAVEHTDPYMRDLAMRKAFAARDAARSSSVGTRSPAAQEPTKAPLIQSDLPFSANAKVELVESKSLNRVETHKVESGVLNGIHYHFYYTDGSGTFSGTSGNVGHYSETVGTNWSTGCKKDPVTDQRYCYMYMKDLVIFVYPKGGVTLSIGTDHFPGSSVTLRLDQGVPSTAPAKDNGSFPPQTSARLVKQLANARTITTRYMKWPYRTWIDQTWDLHGLPETLKYVAWAVDRIR